MIQAPDLHPVWHALQSHVVKSLPEYAIIASLFMVAVIANMVRPDAVRDLLLEDKPKWVKFKEALALGYEWFYTSMQAFMSARHPQPPIATPAPPPAPPQPPKENQ